MRANQYSAASGSCRAPPCAAPRSGRRRRRRPCRSAAGCPAGPAPTASSDRAALAVLFPPGPPISLQQVQRAARIAVGGARQALPRAVIGAGSPSVANAPRPAPAPVLRPRAAEFVDPRAGQQRIVDLEGRVLRGGADEDQRAVLDEGQERVLLCLVEAVHLVDEQHRVSPLAVLRARRRPRRGCPSRPASTADSCQDVGIGGLGGDQARAWSCRHPAGPRGSWSAAGRAPRRAQRLARTEQVRLADELVELVGRACAASGS